MDKCRRGANESESAKLLAISDLLEVYRTPGWDNLSAAIYRILAEVPEITAPTSILSAWTKCPDLKKIVVGALGDSASSPGYRLIGCPLMRVKDFVRVPGNLLRHRQSRAFDRKGCKVFAKITKKNLYSGLGPLPGARGVCHISQASLE